MAIFVVANQWHGKELNVAGATKCWNGIATEAERPTRRGNAAHAVEIFLPRSAAAHVWPMQGTPWRQLGKFYTLVQAVPKAQRLHNRSYTLASPAQSCEP